MNQELINFLIRAKQATYAGKGAETDPSRPGSHDLTYSEGDLTYYDTYLGGDQFGGEEAVWQNGKPIWCMNYMGRVTGHPFSADFLKEALLRVPEDKPYRGPESYSSGMYTYQSSVTGNHFWFQGHEIILQGEKQIYDCYFHGGIIKN